VLFNFLLPRVFLHPVQIKKFVVLDVLVLKIGLPRVNIEIVGSMKS
jgi:hypothetical protein